MRSKPSKILAPLAIAGITIGFLGAAYKFIFVDSKRTKQVQQSQQDNQKTDDEADPSRE